MKYIIIDTYLIVGVFLLCLIGIGVIVMQHKRLNALQEFVDLFVAVLVIVATPVSIFNLVFASSALATVFHSLLLMNLTYYLTVKIITWKIGNGS